MRRAILLLQVSFVNNGQALDTNYKFVELIDKKIIEEILNN